MTGQTTSGEAGDYGAETISQLTLRIKQTLEGSFPSVFVLGELSDVVRAHSGHVYLTLKDTDSQIRGVIWRGIASRLDWDLRDGQEVLCRGNLDVYPPRGSYQLVIRSIDPVGLGALQLALRRLQRELAAEGLFDAERKKRLPRFPRRIAFVTSPSGAAIRDFLEATRTRWRGVHVIVIPARVQGEGAAEDLVRGIQSANQMRPSPDVLVVGRGGGSLEDLWCFNEEVVVRAIAASRIPVVSAVGHEIDVTLSDLAADVRALTPTDAARHAVPSAEEVSQGLKAIEQRLAAALVAKMTVARSRLEALAQRRVLRRPLDQVHESARRVDELHERAGRSMRSTLQRVRDKLAGWSARLDALSPLAVLERGYSLTVSSDDGRLVRDASTLAPKDLITTRFSHGSVESRVESVEMDDADAQQGNES